MDLYAYSQIEDLEHLLVDNNIVISRLRGLRLMSQEEIIPEENIIKSIEEEKKDYLINWLKQHSDLFWSSENENKRHEAFIYGKNEDGEEEIVGYDFSKVHGKDRNHIKYEWKKIEKAFRSQYEMFNSFVGKNVLMVHARQGGGNRPWYPIDTKHPMYICDIDDAWDSTYCDIYYDLDKGTQNDTGDNI